LIVRTFQKYFFDRSPDRIHADNLPAKAPNALQCQTLIGRRDREPHDSVLSEAAGESGRSNSTSDNLGALTRLQEVGCPPQTDQFSAMQHFYAVADQLDFGMQMRAWDTFLAL